MRYPPYRKLRISRVNRRFYLLPRRKLDELDITKKQTFQTIGSRPLRLSSWSADRLVVRLSTAELPKLCATSQHRSVLADQDANGSKINPSKHAIPLRSDHFKSSPSPNRRSELIIEYYCDQFVGAAQTCTTHRRVLPTITLDVKNNGYSPAALLS